VLCSSARKKEGAEVHKGGEKGHTLSSIFEEKVNSIIGLKKRLPWKD